MVPSQTRDVAAFSCLYDKYAPALYGLVLKLAGNSQVAESILVKSFLRIWEELNDYDVSSDRSFSIMLKITLREYKTEVGLPENIVYKLFDKNRL